MISNNQIITVHKVLLNATMKFTLLKKLQTMLYLESITPALFQLLKKMRG